MAELFAAVGRWENILFLVPATVGLLFMFLQFVGFGLDQWGGGHEVDHDIDHDVDHDIGHDVDHDHDIAPGHAHDHHDVHVGEGHGLLAAVLTWFHVGRAPFMVIAQTLLLSFGLFGVLGTTVLGRTQGLHGWPAVGLAAAFSLVAAALSTKALAGAFARWLSTFETKKVTARTLVGATAEVASEVVDERTGRAAARDAQGDLYTVFCRTAPGAPPIKRGDRVVLVAYHADDDRYTVKPLGEKS